MKNKILVLLSAYNGEKYIEEQIESIIGQQTAYDVCICVRDDGSTDSTCKIVEKLQYIHPGKINLIRGSNLGYNASFFKLLEYAQSSDAVFFAFSDQDDIWMPDKLDIAVHLLCNQFIPALFSCTSLLIDDNKNILGMTRKKQRPLSVYNSVVQNICLGHNQVFNRALLNLVDTANTDTKYIFSYDMWMLNIALIFGTVIFDNTPHTFYRQHSQNVFGNHSSIIGRLLLCEMHIKKGDGTKIKTQAEYLLQKFNEPLSKYSDELRKYTQTRGLSGNIRLAFTTKLYRQSKLETLAMRFAILIGML